MSPIKPTGFRWLDAPESRRGLLTGAVTLICVAMLLVTAMRNPVDYDGYWHLRMGMDWLVNGLSPWVDHYSFTYRGEPISGVPYGFQLALYGMVSYFGESGGMIALKFTLFLFIFACMILWLERIKAPILAYLLGLSLLVIAIQLRAQVRPELFSYGLMLVALVLYERTRLRLTASAMLPILLFTLFWVNYHSAVLGYVIFFGLFIDIALRLLKERAPVSEWAQWAGWGLLLVAVGYLHPAFSHPVFALIGGFMGDWGPLIQEYLPPTYYAGKILGYFLPLVAVLTLAGLYWQRKFGLLIVATFFIWSAFTMGRMVAPATVLCAALLPLILRDWQITLPTGIVSSRSVKTVAALTIAVSLFSLYLGLRIARSYMAENQQSWTIFPQQIVQHYKARGYSGRIFNDYETGGYLLYKLAPESEVYIDGRTGILYPVEHHLRYVNARRFSEVFLEEVERYGIESSIMQSNPDTVVMMDGAGWTLDFVDVKFLLYRPSDGRLRHFGKVWATPYCWNEELRGSLAGELAYLRPGSGSPIPPTVPLMYFALGFAVAKDSTSFIKEVASDYDEDDAGRRFFAARALANGVPEVAINLAEKVEHREPRDDLVPVIALAQQGKWEAAQLAMEVALSRPWRVVTTEEQQLQLQLIDWLSESVQLSPLLVESRSAFLSAAWDSKSEPVKDWRDALCLAGK